MQPNQQQQFMSAKAHIFRYASRDPDPTAAVGDMRMLVMVCPIAVAMNCRVAH